MIYLIFIYFYFKIGIPVPERFAFYLNTLLSDTASLNEDNSNEIINHQINLLSSLCSTIETNLSSSQPIDNVDKSECLFFLVFFFKSMTHY